MGATSRSPNPSAWPSAVVMFVDGTANTVSVTVNGTDGRVDGDAGRVKSPVDPVELSINGFFSDLLVISTD